MNTFNSESANIAKLEFIGLDTQYPTADGKRIRRLHLDGAASPLACKAALDSIQFLLPHYSNTHSYVHNSAKITTKALTWAHNQVLNFVGASPDTYTCIFSGAGTTAATNRIARGLHASRSDKSVVLVSEMEHHANDLPHRQFDNQVHYIPLTGSGAKMGAIDLHAFEMLLKEHQQKINYVAVSSVSNVTGISNPISELTELAHKYGAYIVVDAAQSVAHKPSNLDQSDVDFFIFSGHKVYAPTAPGVLVAKKALLENMDGQDLGGGSVSTVSYFDYQLATSYPDREQSGTPNIVGAIALGGVLKTLSHANMSNIRQAEEKVISRLLNELEQLEQLVIYGDLSAPRTGAIAFNHRSIDHGLLAAILNDYYAIAVRNECFCAHPYVSNLIKEELWELDLSEVDEEQQENYLNRKRGMVRASISAYTNDADIDYFIHALKDIEKRFDELSPNYQALADGSYEHQTFALDWKSELGALINDPE